MWHNPIPKYDLIPTHDNMSFLNFSMYETGIPLPPHVGSYNIPRKFDIHKGIDLYCLPSTIVHCVESGTVTEVGVFTGHLVNSPWWHTTMFVSITGNTGTVVYGEITTNLKHGDAVQTGQVIGKVVRVLRTDKGRPTSMLHLELLQNNTHVDPTPYIQQIKSNR